MGTRVLENVSGRMRTFILSGAHLATHPTHEHRYKPVKLVTVHQSKSGHLVPRATARSMPDSLRFAAGEKREVDEAVLHCPEVKAAIASGNLRLESKPEPKADTKADEKQFSRSSPPRTTNP